MTGGDDRGGDGDELGAAHLAEHVQRIGDPGDAAHRLLHGGALHRQRGVVDAGAAADPCRRLAAGERRGHRRRDGCVADAHLADHEEVAVEGVDGGPGDVDDLGEPFRRHRRLDADVAGRLADPDVDRRHGGPGVAGEAADRRAALGEGGEHRRRDLRLEGADLCRRGHAVIGGEHHADGTLDRRERLPMPAGDPRRQVVEPLQRAGRAEDVGGAGVHSGDRRLVRLG